MGMKGVSPLIATILLIAFTVGIAGIIITWLSGYASTTTGIISSSSDKTVTCLSGSVNLKNLIYKNPRLSGTIVNNGQIALGNMTLSIEYHNASSQQIELCSPATGIVSCTVSNLSLKAAERGTFNITIGGSNYKEITVTSNCSSVIDTSVAADVSTT